jgi:tRNA-binding EMAP/Myf-like protein
MPVIAMEIIAAAKHKNADALRLYTMKAPGRDEVQIIANLENVYQVGDIVAVALVDSILKDGTKIKLSKLRGVYSYGMVLGKVEAEIGSDLSEIYCQKSLVNNPKEFTFLKWTSIELLHNVRRNLEIVGQAFEVIYRAKIKLHGTNAGVQITPEGKVAAQKRSQFITPESDNANFAAWVYKNIDYFARLKAQDNITIYGEWCGANIQKGVAISQINRKIFAVFAIQYGGVNGSIAKLEIRPEKIREFLPQHEDIFVIPFYGETITLNFGDVEQLKTVLETINKIVESVEAIDPWVKDTFAIEGVGEGLVLYPVTNGVVERASYTELMFKAKGLEHQVIKSKNPVQIDAEVANNIQEFVDLFVTEKRLEQGVTEACGGEYDLKKMGQFLKWISLDINKESVAELEAAGLTWQEVNKPMMNTARNWYKNKTLS